MPSHRMNSGTQAIDGIARSACSGRIEQPRQRRIAGDRAERGAGDDAEAEARRHPRQRRQRVALQFAALRQLDDGAKITRGGGTSRPRTAQPAPPASQRREQRRQQKPEHRPRVARASRAGRRPSVRRGLPRRCVIGEQGTCHTTRCKPPSAMAGNHGVLGLGAVTARPEPSSRSSSAGRCSSIRRRPPP